MFVQFCILGKRNMIFVLIYETANEMFNNTLNFSVRLQEMGKGEGYAFSLFIQYTINRSSSVLLMY